MSDRHMSPFIHPSATELKEQLGVCSRSVFGMEPSQMSFLFFIMYAAAAGGVMALLESTPGCAQEFKIKVHQSDHSPADFIVISKQVVIRHVHLKFEACV